VRGGAVACVRDEFDALPVSGTEQHRRRKENVSDGVFFMKIALGGRGREGGN
jgi:hypothetical protein